ncbi:MAG: ABC transporter permease [Muribaculaceae bacterium]|nr:ABC transporter permease [Muribaculaceae bacterium]
MLALRIALRYLLAKKSHTAVNVISLISMAGIAVAAMAMICVLSVFNGFSDLAFERLSLVDPDVKVTPVRGKVILNADSLAGVVGKVDGVRSAVVTVEDQALAIFDGAQSPVVIHGVPADYSELSAISSLVIDGEFVDEVSGRPCVALSVGSAINLGARPSLEKPFVLTVPRRLGRINPAFPLAAFCTDTLLVSAVYQTNQAEFDNDMLYLPLESARSLLDYTTEGSAIEIAVADGVNHDDVIDRLQELLGDGYVVADRLHQQADSFRMISVEKWITFLMLVFVLVMASFNILSTMSMLIIEKEDNLRILRSLGATESLLRRIFLDEGLLIALLGGAIGLAVGVALCLAQQQFGLISLGGDHAQMSIDAYPCRLALSDLCIVIGVVGVIGLLSGFVSSRSLPADVVK